MWFGVFFVFELILKFCVVIRCEDMMFFDHGNTADGIEEFYTASRSSGRILDIYPNNYRDREGILEYSRPTYRNRDRSVAYYPSLPHDRAYYPNLPYDRSDTVNFENIEQIFPVHETLHPEHESVKLFYGNTDSSKVKNHHNSEKKNSVFTPSQLQATPTFEDNYYDHTTRRPNFLTQNYKNSSTRNTITIHKKLTTVKPKQSYVQKIPKRPQENNMQHNNKYEEIDMIASPSTNFVTDNVYQSNKINVNSLNSNNNMKNKINNILKRYLAKLYTQKYGNNKVNINNNKNKAQRQKNPKLQDTTDPEDPKLKFLNSDTFLQIKNKTINKINKLFGIFTVVKFNNTECNATNATGTWQGVCYTELECTKYNGTALGNCANGYGVCCVFMGTCGSSSNQNCTYFISPNYPDYYPSDGGDGGSGAVVIPTTQAPIHDSGTPDPRGPWYHFSIVGDRSREQFDRQNGDTSMSCGFSVYKKNDEVKQMRIDFIDMELTGPRNGTCSDERLVISGQNTNNPVPIICGYNSGQHVYVDVSTLSGPLQLMVLSNSGARKRFKIRICQLSDSTCTSPNSNCLQYYTGVTGVIQSFNYDQAAALNRSTPGYYNNLNYAICIRKEAGYCSITYTNVRNGVEYPFQLVNFDDTGVCTIPRGQAGVDITNCPDDYIVIDGTRLCGDKFNDGSTVDDFTMNAPVTDTSAGPIVASVRTNSNTAGIGFKLFYMQNLCNS